MQENEDIADKKFSTKTFWGYTFITMGLLYVLMNFLRDNWSVDNSIVPIIEVMTGLLILSLKNTGRAVRIGLICFVFLTGIVILPDGNFSTIEELGSEEVFLHSFMLYLLRFVVALIVNGSIMTLKFRGCFKFGKTAKQSAEHKR